MPKHNRPGHRRCFACKIEFELSSEFFHVERKRSAGLAYRCKSCQAVVAASKPKRPQRWGNMTPTQRAARKTSQQKYWMGVSLARKRLLSYQAMDKRKGQEFDLDLAWYEDNIHNQPCHYCGDAACDVGCDRIANTQGHTKNNVVPACKICNVARMDNFTYEEMIILGESIRKIKLLRTSLVTAPELAGKAYA